jgi:GYF domain 2
MSTYWLSRDGGEPKGPFVESQLRSMWSKGLITAADLLRAEGAETWHPS